jgi:hypothetical protein
LKIQEILKVLNDAPGCAVAIENDVDQILKTLQKHQIKQQE